METSLCLFDSPDLPSVYHGLKPTFAFGPGDTNNFGVSARFLDANGKTCTYTPGQSMVPVLATGSTTYSCSLGLDEENTSILCNGVANTALSTGDYTISFDKLHPSETKTPVGSAIVVGPSPTIVTDTVYSIITKTKSYTTSGVSTEIVLTGDFPATKTVTNLAVSTNYTTVAPESCPTSTPEAEPTPEPEPAQETLPVETATKTVIVESSPTPTSESVVPLTSTTTVTALSTNTVIESVEPEPEVVKLGRRQVQTTTVSPSTTTTVLRSSTITRTSTLSSTSTDTATRSTTQITTSTVIPRTSTTVTQSSTQITTSTAPTSTVIVSVTPSTSTVRVTATSTVTRSAEGTLTTSSMATPSTRTLTSTSLTIVTQSQTATTVTTQPRTTSTRITISITSVTSSRTTTVITTPSPSTSTTTRPTSTSTVTRSTRTTSISTITPRTTSTLTRASTSTTLVSLSSISTRTVTQSTYTTATSVTTPRTTITLSPMSGTSTSRTTPSVSTTTTSTTVTVSPTTRTTSRTSVTTTTETSTVSPTTRTTSTTSPSVTTTTRTSTITPTTLTTPSVSTSTTSTTITVSPIFQAASGTAVVGATTRSTTISTTTTSKVSQTTRATLARKTTTTVTPSPISTSTRSKSKTVTALLVTTTTQSTTTTGTPSETNTTTSGPTAAPTDLTCPESNGTTFTTSAGVFVVECYVDRLDFDLSTVNATDLGSCAATCANTPSCVDVSFIPPSNPGNVGPCYLKYGKGVSQSNSNVWGASLQDFTTPTTTSEQGPATPSSTDISCPSSDGMTFTFNGKTFIIECYVDRSDGDLTTDSPLHGLGFVGCMQACAIIPGCVDVSSSGYVCYLKGTANGANYNPAVWGAILQGAIPSATTTALPAVPAVTGSTCPATNGSTITTDCGSQYVVECYLDRYDSDVAGSPQYVNSLDACAAACDNVSGCVDVSWAPGLPGPCYFKSNVLPGSSNVNLWSARQVAGCTQVRRSRFPKIRKLHRKRVALVPRPLVKAEVDGYDGPEYTYVDGTATTISTATITTFGATVPPSATTTITHSAVTGTRTVTVDVVAYITSTVTAESLCSEVERVTVTITTTQSPMGRW